MIPRSDEFKKVILSKCNDVPAITMVGIYFLIRFDEVIYIGKSVNVQARVCSHSNNGDIWFDRAVFYACDVSELDDFERKMISIFLPKKNGDSTTRKYRRELLFGIATNSKHLSPIEKKEILHYLRKPYVNRKRIEGYIDEILYNSL